MSFKGVEDNMRSDVPKGDRPMNQKDLANLVLYYAVKTLMPRPEELILGQPRQLTEREIAALGGFTTGVRFMISIGVLNAKEMREVVDVKIKEAVEGTMKKAAYHNVPIPPGMLDEIHTIIHSLISERLTLFFPKGDEFDVDFINEHLVKMPDSTIAEAADILASVSKKPQL